MAQAEGLIRKDLRSLQLSIMILGIAFFWLDNRRHFAARFGKAANDNAYLNTAVKMIEEGLLPRFSASKSQDEE